MREMPSLFDRTFDRFRRAFQSRNDDDPTQLPSGIDADLNDVAEVRKLIDRSLSQTSAVAARATAAEIGQIYLKLSETGRLRFLGLLAEDYAVEEEAVSKAIARYQAATAPEGREQARFALQDTLRPPARRLIPCRFGTMPRPGTTPVAPAH